MSILGKVRLLTVHNICYRTLMMASGALAFTEISCASSDSQHQDVVSVFWPTQSLNSPI